MSIANSYQSWNLLMADKTKKFWPSIARIPLLMFPNSKPETSMTNNNRLLLMVKPGNSGQLEKTNSLFENRVFEGIMSAELFMDLTFRCGLEFTNYPFDHQTCKIMVSFFGRDKTSKFYINEIYNIWSLLVQNIKNDH